MFPVYSKPEAQMDGGLLREAGSNLAEAWNAPGLPERPPTLLAPAAEVVMEGLDRAGTAPFQSAMFPGGPVSKYVTAPIAEPAYKILTGQPMNFGETALSLAGGIKAAGAMASSGLSFLQKSL